jgi:chromosomal replication initiation ATPase DnaA
MGNIQDPTVFLATQRTSTVRFVVGQFYGVPVEDLRKPTRGRPHVARARQIAMHLARSVFAMSNRQLAQEFGRDRSTVQHACEVIGRMRMDSSEFDASLRWMETMLRKAAGMAV